MSRIINPISFAEEAIYLNIKNNTINEKNINELIKLCFDYTVYFNNKWKQKYKQDRFKSFFKTIINLFNYHLSKYSEYIDKYKILI